MPHLAFALLFCQYLLACAPAKITGISLSESTRGTWRSIEVREDSTTVTLNDTEDSFPTKTADWQALTKMAEAFPPTRLGQVEVLSKKHQVDAALASTLTIVTADSTFASPTFDHNAPPAALTALVDSLYRQIPASMQDRYRH